MAKRKKIDKKTNKKPSLKKEILIFFSVLFFVAGVSFAYALGNQDKVIPIIKILEVKKTEPRVIKPIIIKEKITEENKTKILKPQKQKKIIFIPTQTKKPRLSIVIDDVSNKKQINRIEALGMNITASIFPPSKLSMTSHTLVRGLKHSMIHLPMQSDSYQFNKQYKTLKITFTKKQIEARVSEIRRLFPHTKYINNHTGSKFTKHYTAMKHLYKALRKQGFIFLDSRTSGKSKVKKIAKSFGDVYIARDIFIDNVHKVSAIHKQLRRAVKIAKGKGHAIVIGHPHRVTMRALRSAKKILKDVELVYLDEMYKEK